MMDAEVGVALINPKFPANVGNVWRACSVFHAPLLLWTPERVLAPDDWPSGTRLPREERMKLYQHVAAGCAPASEIIDTAQEWSLTQMTPVAVELRDNAEPLPLFEHPRNALYVFGPEDGSLDKGILTACHRFVRIPSASCLNLAAAVNVVLYDRIAKQIVESLNAFV
jgi:tRNA(Leu) C34 or U34 (ribose-2'-O)-methylase TrmL